MAREEEIQEEIVDENITPEDDSQEDASGEQDSVDQDAVKGAEQSTDGETNSPQEDGEPEQNSSEEEVSNNAKESKKLFKGKEKAEKKKDKSKEIIGELEDKVKRQMAEFDNFRKRTEKEKAQMFEVGAKSVVEKILPVVDNFERGLSSVPEDENSKAFVDGMKMIYKQLMTELETIGVTPIEAVGQEFNPEFHNAVMQVESDEYESGVVAQELQKGYMYRDSVVRHSMVSVVQ